MRAMPFSGFPVETTRFLAALHDHNDKKWFSSHRKDYEAYYLAPAKALVEALAAPLKRIDKRVRAVPEVNGSILRINRDVRFSKDKSPYKDHLDLFFWSGPRKGWDHSGFFFRLTPTKLVLGAGMHAFSPAMLARYRKAVLNAKKGEALARAVLALREAGYEVGGETYKKTPKGVPADHPRAGLLRHSGLHAGWGGDHPDGLHSPAFLAFAATHFASVAPIHAWLKAM